MKTRLLIAATLALLLLLIAANRGLNATFSPPVPPSADVLLQRYQDHPQWSTADKLATLTDPVLRNDPRAHFYLGKLWYQLDQLTRAQLWLKSAAAQGHLTASVLYVQIQIEQGELDHAQQQLETPPLRGTSEAQLLAAKLSLQRNQIDSALVLLQALPNQPEAVVLANELNQLLAANYNPPECRLTLQFVVGGYQPLRYATTIIQQWQQDDTVNRWPVCFAPPITFEPKAYNCLDQAGTRLNCELTLLAEQLPLAATVLPVVVYGAHANANYNNGIIFLSDRRSYPVFKHELFHHFGFIDEYPLTGAIGASVCQVQEPTLAGENLLILPANKLNQGLQQDLTAVETCAAFASEAFKSVRQLTLMGFMDLPMPPSYLQKAHHKLLEDRGAMANYQYAYALAFEQQNQPLKYQYWLEQSAIQGYDVSKKLVQNSRNGSAKKVSQLAN